VVDVVISAAKLFARLDGFSGFLKPGLTHEEVAALENFHRVTLPQEVQRFYSAYNLATVTGDDKAFFYGDYWMLGLQQALIKKQMVAELAAEFFGDIAGSGEWLPFMQSENGYYLVDSHNADEAHAPVLFMYSGAEPELRFRGLGAMFSTFEDWLAEGALHVSGGVVESNDRADRKHLATIAVRHNPRVEYWQDWL
jgi:hypothetical protein